VADAQTTAVCAFSDETKEEGDSPDFPQSVAGSENHQREDDTQKYYGVVYGITLMPMRKYPRCYAKHQCHR
jgi:hypothetical protein